MKGFFLCIHYCSKSHHWCLNRVSWLNKESTLELLFCDDATLWVNCFLSASSLQGSLLFSMHLYSFSHKLPFLKMLVPLLLAVNLVFMVTLSIYHLKVIHTNIGVFGLVFCIKFSFLGQHWMGLSIGKCRKYQFLELFNKTWIKLLIFQYWAASKH